MGDHENMPILKASVAMDVKLRWTADNMEGDQGFPVAMQYLKTGAGICKPEMHGLRRAGTGALNMIQMLV